MNFGRVFQAFDAVVALRDAAKRFKGEAPAEIGLTQTAAASGLAGQIEARLTNVVVAALKEAFDRDHARLELERTQIEEQRRRAEDAMRMELRRQAADRELGRLRLLAGAALAGWIASVMLLVVRMGGASTASRALLAVGWLLLLGSLGSAFTAQGRVGTDIAETSGPIVPSPAGGIALWLLIAGLAISAISLLF